MNDQRLRLAIKTSAYIADVLIAEARGVTASQELEAAHREIVLATVKVILWERENDFPYTGVEDDLLSIKMVRGLHYELAERAEVIRKDVLRQADRMVDAYYHRGNDPVACDPGGGMRSPFEIEEDEQF